MEMRVCLIALLIGLSASAAGAQKPQQKKLLVLPANRQPSQAPPAAPVDCFSEAKHRTFLDDEQATRLCRCQHSTKNVDCFVQAKLRTFLEDEAALRLCAGTEENDLNCVDY